MADPVPPPAGPFAVQARKLAKMYPSGDEELTVLQDVDLDVRRGEFVSIMGPSGSGKSTLLNLVGLLDAPSAGAIRLMGTDTQEMGASERALMRRSTLGFVFQSFNLMPRLSALHNVMLPMAIAGVPRRERVPRAKALLESVGLGDRAKHRPNQLSGGQKQRVAIARALALDPPILLADEPTGNLDSRTSVEIMQLFQSLNRAGKTILQVTHSDEMAAFGTRTVRFRDGRIIANAAVPADAHHTGAVHHAAHLAVAHPIPVTPATLVARGPGLAPSEAMSPGPAGKAAAKPGARTSDPAGKPAAKRTSAAGKSPRKGGR